MESLEITAKTVEEATQEALDRLGVSREEVEVEVVKEGKSGILGLGGDEAVVRVTLLEQPPAGEPDDMVRETIEKLLDLMGVECTVNVTEEPSEEPGGPESVSIDIEGDELGILIGRRGQTLSSLQYIVRLVVGHQTGVWQPITIDVEGYKHRRKEGLQDFALQMAEQVAARNAPFSLEPMPAYERRLVHISLADHPDVQTESIGVGDQRRVVILPKGTTL